MIRNKKTQKNKIKQIIFKIKKVKAYILIYLSET